MLTPAALNGVGVEPALAADKSGIQQVFGPRAQWTLDPFADRYPEPGLGTVDELRRDEAVEKLANDMLASPSLNLEAERDARSELGDAMVEERNASLERNRHRCAVDLGENVVGKVADRVAIHHANGVRSLQGEIEIEAEVGIFAADHRRAFVAPFVKEAQIDIVEGASGRDDAQPFLNLDTKVRLVPPRHQANDIVPQTRRHTAERRARGGTQRPGHTLELLPQARRGEMAVVTGEQLVPAVAGQRDRHLLAREAADEVRRNLR